MDSGAARLGRVARPVVAQGEFDLLDFLLGAFAQPS